MSSPELMYYTFLVHQRVSQQHRHLPQGTDERVLRVPASRRLRSLLSARWRRPSGRARPVTAARVDCVA
jgi:transposase